MNLKQIWNNIKKGMSSLCKQIFKMKKHNHLANLKVLEEKVFILNGYDYTDNDPKGLAELFFQFCQTNLSENKEFDIQPALFYVREEKSVNALAAKRNGYYVIGVNIGTLVTMHNFFVNRQEIFENPLLSDFKLLDSKLDISIPELMYQVCTQFTYYHELAHLIQFSPLDIGIQESTEQPMIEVEEAYAHTTGPADPYSGEKHVKEFDADLNGGHYTCLHLIDYWKMPKKRKLTWSYFYHSALLQYLVILFFCSLVILRFIMQHPIILIH